MSTAVEMWRENESPCRKDQTKWNIRPSFSGSGVNTCSFTITFWILSLFLLGPQYKFRRVPNHQLFTLA